MFVRDLNGNEYAVQATITVKDDLNGASTLTAEIDYNKVNALFIEKLDRLWEIYDHDEVGYKITNLTRRGSGDKLTVSLSATFLFKDYMDTHSIMDSNGDHYRYDGSLTAFNAFSKIFEGTPFTFVILDNLSASSWENFGGGESKLETFNRALDHYKCEFRVEKDTVYLESIVTRPTSMQFRHGFKSSNIVQEIDASAQYTAVRGYGDYGDGEGGEDYQNAKLKRDYVSPLATILGKRYSPPFTNGNVKIVVEMDRNLKEIVDESLKVSISADYHELRNQKFPVGKTKPGDGVFVIDERIKFDEEVRIVEQDITYEWTGNIIDANYTFGNEGLGKRHQSQLNTAVKNITDVFEGRKQLPLSALDKRVQEISNIINGNTDSVFEYMPNGIRGWNGDDPNYMTRYVGDAIGFSRDGGVTYGTAMSAKLGIVADYITTGTLRAIIVDGVEIYGSYFESRVDDDEYLYIQGATLLSHGKFTRTWAGETDLAKLELGIYNGQVRFRNDDTGYRLYGTERGFSTSMDGAIDQFTSGTLEFHSQRFNKASRGVTLHSSYGTVGLVSDFSTIISRSKLTNNIESEDFSVWVRPYMKSRPGNNEFRFWVKEAASSSDTDGVLSYGSELTNQASGIRFKKSTVGNPTVYATNGNGDVRTGTFHAEYFDGTLLGNMRAGETNLYAMVAYDGELRVTDKSGYNDGSMTFRPIVASSFNKVSSLKYKENIKNYEGNALMLLNNLDVVTYDYINGEKNELGFISEYSESISTEFNDAIDISKLSSLNTKGIQELDDKYKTLEKRMELLEGA